MVISETKKEGMLVLEYTGCFKKSFTTVVQMLLCGECNFFFFFFFSNLNQ
jgi:hypothetical protein